MCWVANHCSISYQLSNDGPIDLNLFRPGYPLFTLSAEFPRDRVLLENHEVSLLACGSCSLSDLL